MRYKNLEMRVKQRLLAIWEKSRNQTIDAKKSRAAQRLLTKKLREYFGEAWLIETRMDKFVYEMLDDEMWNHSIKAFNAGVELANYMVGEFLMESARRGDIKGLDEIADLQKQHPEVWGYTAKVYRESEYKALEWKLKEVEHDAWAELLKVKEAKKGGETK